MPVGRVQQSRATFYTLITFVGLFFISTVLAIIFYVNSESARKKADKLQNQIDELASRSELQRIGAIVGSKQGRKSRLGTMVDYVDRMTTAILGGVAEDTSAEVKADTVSRKVTETMDGLASSGIDITEPNTAGLISVIEILKTKLKQSQDNQQELKTRLEELKNRFDDAVAAGIEKEQLILTEKEMLQQQVRNIEQDYNEIKTLLEKTSEQQVKMLSQQLDEEKDKNRKLNQSLLKTRAELKIAEDRVKYVQDRIATLVSPDIEASARRADGKILLIDDKNKIVHLDIGRRDGVYQGLTFSVYDRNVPIPKDGKGKAEVEIIEVATNISTAQITHSEINRPIIVEDIAANLIWDRDKVNVFVVVGDFDLDSDGNVDSNADYKIKTLIEKWGGKVADNISIETDFLVLGRPPSVLRSPTFEEIEMDPAAMERYENSVQRLNHYKEVHARAQAFSIPVFNYNRFLNLIGYTARAAEPGAF